MMGQDEWTGNGQKTPRQAHSPSAEENGVADDAAGTGDADDNEVQVSTICACEALLSRQSVGIGLCAWFIQGHQRSMLQPVTAMRC